MNPITPATPTGPLTIAGKSFTVHRPFAAGDTITEGEASSLNGSFAENMRNLFSEEVKKAGDAVDIPAIQAKLNERAAGYIFGATGGGGFRTADPVEQAALDIARGKVRDAMRKQGFAMKDVKDSQITQLAREALEKHPEYRTAAQAQVDAAKSIADLELNATAPGPAPAKGKKGE